MLDTANSARERYVDAATGNPVSASPFAIISNYNLSIFYIMWHLVVTHWNLANYVAWVRFNGPLLGDRPNERLYVAFVVISSVLFWLVCGPLFFYTAKYKKSTKDRNRYLGLGIGLAYIFADVPLWLLDVSIVYFHGFLSVVQVTALILRSISFFLNSFVAWHIYLHRITKYLHRLYGKSSGELRAQALRDATRAQRARDGINGNTSGFSFTRYA